jgi:hypothetical protein
LEVITTIWSRLRQTRVTCEHVSKAFAQRARADGQHLEPSISTVTTERGTQQCLKLSGSLRAAFVSIQCTLGRGVVDCKIYWVGRNGVT